MSATKTNSEFLRGARDIVPLAAGAAMYGLAFGVLAAQAAMDSLEVGIMGGLVFAGAAQIVTVERVISGAGALLAVIAGITINLRFLLITASIRDVYQGRSFWQILLGAHLTVDENWALLLSERANGNPAGYWYLIGSGMTTIGFWVCSTILGILFASSIPEPRSFGLDFAFVAAFIAISRSLWQGYSDILPWCTSLSVVLAFVGIWKLDTSLALLAGGISGAVISGVCDER